MRKTVDLPTTASIIPFFEYLSDIREAAYSEVTRTREEGEEFPVEEWHKVAKCSMVCLEVLNRRRSGAVEKIEIRDYQKINRINESSDEYKNMSEIDRGRYFLITFLKSLRILLLLNRF